MRNSFFTHLFKSGGTALFCMAIMSPCAVSAADSHAGHADISLMTSQQDKIVVTGIVTDSNGEPLIGVNVLEKGTANGVITGLDGDFTLSVSGSESVLVFSYIGYKEVTVRVGSETSFSISMSEDTQQIYVDARRQKNDNNDRERCSKAYHSPASERRIETIYLRSTCGSKLSEQRNNRVQPKNNRVC